MTSSTGDVSLVVTDLDGTLWHTDDEVHPSATAALHEVLRSGPPLLVATGRRLTSTRVPLARLGISPPAIVLNGALGIDLATAVRFHRAPFPTSEAVAVLEAFEATGLDPCVYCDGVTVEGRSIEVWLSPTPSTNEGHVEQLAPSAAVGDLSEVVRREAVLAFSVLGVQHGRLVAAQEAIGDIAEVHLDRALDFPGLAALTVAPHGQSKWDGVLAFCRMAGVDSTKVLVLADGPNDIELLTNAAHRLVPDNAHPAAKALADHLIPAAADGGWACVADHL